MIVDTPIYNEILATYDKYNSEGNTEACTNFSKLIKKEFGIEIPGPSRSQQIEKVIAELEKELQRCDISHVFGLDGPQGQVSFRDLWN
ncbi:hypothetical protein DFS34DRAFT_683420 [Phlyctochytrium arcticum]|nr:hypothetical protein DFS34DRAFT_683420 [Phlyctochytrium arcticum]